MKFGLQWSLRSPATYHRPFEALYRDTLDEVVAAEALGIESAWLSEHHFCDDGYLPSVMPALGALAARTSSIRLGPYVALAPLHHPIRLAEDAAVLDILSGGRLDLALGSGYKLDEFEHLGVDRSTRGRRAGETVAVLLRSWSDEPVTFSGQIYSFDGVPVTPKPIQRPIPVYLGGVARPVLARVAELGVTGVAGVPAAEDMEFFHGKLAEHGRDAASIRYLPFRYLWVDRDDGRARRTAEPLMEWVISRYAKWLGEAGTDRYQGRDPASFCITGSPEYCVEKLGRFMEHVSYAAPDRIIIQPPLLGLDHKASMAMIETFATEVAPHL